MWKFFNRECNNVLLYMREYTKQYIERYTIFTHMSNTSERKKIAINVFLWWKQKKNISVARSLENIEWVIVDENECVEEFSPILWSIFGRKIISVCVNAV